MKVLYIGNWKDGTGWGNACLNNILAMDKAGIEVVPRAISFESSDCEYPERIKELSQTSQYGCDICIQHTLPHLYSYDGRYKNIGFIETESTSFRDIGWGNYCNLMDEMWSPCLATQSACRISGVKKPINIVPHSLDISAYLHADFTKKLQELENSFNFIFVGEFVERKNIQALLIAFHSEFRNNEPVNLVLKTSKQSVDYINSYCENVKRGLKLRKNYKKEIVISGKLRFNDYLSVIKQCHSFVMPSRGEAFCIPLLESMALGIPAIYTANTGMEDFAYGTRIHSNKRQCFGCVDSPNYLDNANSSWYEIDIQQLKFAMRGQYMKWRTKKEKTEREEAIETALKLDHKVVGQKIKDILYDC